jgi:deazaflavin-dependent oxidoreductase (nitroreductase family)
MSIALGAGNLLLDTLPPKAQTSAWKIFQGSHLAMFRATGGRLGATFGGVTILVLHHVGAKSGRVRVSPLLYVDDGSNLAVIASKGGHVRHPAWFHNLMAHPDVEVETRDGRREVHARVAEGEERERLWAKAVAVWPDYERYRERAPHRQIPVVVLEPRAPTVSAQG